MHGIVRVLAPEDSDSVEVRKDAGPHDEPAVSHRPMTGGADDPAQSDVSEEVQRRQHERTSARRYFSPRFRTRRPQ